MADMGVSLPGRALLGKRLPEPPAVSLRYGETVSAIR
jgi:hypothetical protein